MGVVYSSLGSSIKDAIMNLNVPKANGLGILTMEKGGVRKEKILGGHITSRLFTGSPMSKEIALKQAGSLFDL